MFSKPILRSFVPHLEQDRFRQDMSWYLLVPFFGHNDIATISCLSAGIGHPSGFAFFKASTFRLTFKHGSHRADLNLCFDIVSMCLGLSFLNFESDMTPLLRNILLFFHLLYKLPVVEHSTDFCSPSLFVFFFPPSMKPSLSYTSLTESCISEETTSFRSALQYSPSRRQYFFHVSILQSNILVSVISTSFLPDTLWTNVTNTFLSRFFLLLFKIFIFLFRLATSMLAVIPGTNVVSLTKPFAVRAFFFLGLSAIMDIKASANFLGLLGSLTGALGCLALYLSRLFCRRLNLAVSDSVWPFFFFSCLHTFLLSSFFCWIASCWFLVCACAHSSSSSFFLFSRYRLILIFVCCLCVSFFSAGCRAR